MSESLHIRAAVVSDAAEIARLATELGYPATTHEMSLRLSSLLPLANHFVSVAQRSGSLIGWVAAECRLLLQSGERAEIAGLVVEATSRGAGVGRALVSTAEKWAVAQNLKLISVRSDISRLESHPFYESIGYVLKKTQHSYVKQLAVQQDE